MERFWKNRKSDWFRGGYVWVDELMKKYHLWEVEPMCDSFNVCVDTTGEWGIFVKRSYIEPDGKRITTCHEPFVKVDGLSKDVVLALYEKIMSNKYRLPEIKDMLETAKYEAEAMKLMP